MNPNWTAPIPGRHLLAWLTIGDNESGIVYPDGDDAVISAVVRWRRNGWPAIVRREVREERQDGLVPLGIPLPPSEGKRRLSFWAKREAVRSFQVPPSLCEVITSAPPSWSPCLGAVWDQFSKRQLGVFVYGALLWQHLTGMEYLREGSDLDLLCTGPHQSATEAFLAAQELTAIRLDGEIYLPGFGWVAWRELAHNESHLILIKHDEGEYLINRSQLLGAVDASH